MQRISIENAKPGQILAQKIQRHDGVLLAGQGAEITDGLLRMLERLNIETVVIEQEDKRTPEELAAEFEEGKKLLDARFMRVEDQPVLMALKKAMIQKAQKEMEEILAAMPPPAEEKAPEPAPKEAAPVAKGGKPNAR